MPGMPPPAKDERQTVLEFLRFNQNAFFAVAYGLTDDQARSKPSVSALSIGGLVKHAAGVQRGWMERVKAAPEYPPKDERPMAEIIADYEDEYVMRDDETLDQLLDRLRAQNETRCASSTGRLGHADPGAARCAVVPAGPRLLECSLGGPAPDRGADPACRARRHHPRICRRRNDVRADCRSRGVAGDRLDQALEASCVHMTPRAHGLANPRRFSMGSSPLARYQG